VGAMDRSAIRNIGIGFDGKKLYFSRIMNNPNHGYDGMQSLSVNS